MYDPVVGRFLGVDPVVQAPDYSQSYNGYSYCWNNPLKYTDPSGYLLDAGSWERAMQESFLRRNGYSQTDIWLMESNTIYDSFYESGYGYGSSFYYSTKQLLEDKKKNTRNGYWVREPYDPLNPCICERFVYYNGVASGQGDFYRYGSPESEILWGISATGAVLTKTKEAQRTIETVYRLNQLKPYSVDINTGKVLWVNPSLLKWSRWAGFANTTGDLFNAVGILYNVFWRGEGLNATNTFDGIFGAIGFIPIYGDAAALWYMGVKALVKTEGYQNASKVWYEYGFSPSFRHCFVEGSKIALDNITVKNIEDIQVDDSVLTYNFKDKRFEINRVLEKVNAVDIRLIRVVFSNKVEIISTEDHPYFILNKGWCSFSPELTYNNYGISVGEIEIYDVCLTLKNRRLKKVKVVQIDRIAKPLRTFNISKIGNSNNYFVNGILVRNENDSK